MRRMLFAIPLTLAALGTVSFGQAPGNVADIATQMSGMVQGRQIDALSKLPIPQDDRMARLVNWRDQYVTQMTRSEELRAKQYQEQVNKAQEFFKKERWRKAADTLVRAMYLSHNQEEFTLLPWVADMAKSLADQAAKYESSGRWLESLTLYSDLDSIYAISAQYKHDMQRLARRVRLLAMYDGQALFEMRKAIAKQEKEEEAAATQPSSTTQAAATQGADAETETADDTAPTFPKWQDHVDGINDVMMFRALRYARDRWVETISYESLIRGGLDSLRLFTTMPELGKEFPALKDEKARAGFVAALDAAVAQLATVQVDESRMQKIVNDLEIANANTIKLPAEVFAMEFTDGAMEKLDPFTAVIWPRELAEFEKNTRGTFGGVGVQISLDNQGKLKVVSPLEDTPAFNAGIEAGDEITAINGKTTLGITIDQAVLQISGKPDTDVTLTIKRIGKSEPIDFKLTRAMIRVVSVKGYKRDPEDPNRTRWLYMIDPDTKIGYVRVTQFQNDTAEELRKALQDLQNSGMRGLVLDLRFNPGGLLDQAVEMSDMFLDRGTIVSTRGRVVHRQEIQADRDTFIPNTMPMIVLVNQYSASASEIFSGAMKDLHRATIVGQRSFGKGSVQNILPLGEKALMKLTMSKYYLPEGESLHRNEGSKTWGVEPDVIVDMTPNQIQSLLANRRDVDVISRTSATQPAPTTAAAATKPDIEPLLDTQLDTALMLLRLQLIQSGNAVASGK